MSLLQATTQIQESTLSVVPKLCAAVLALVDRRPVDRRPAHPLHHAALPRPARGGVMNALRAAPRRIDALRPHVVAVALCAARLLPVAFLCPLFGGSSGADHGEAGRGARAGAVAARRRRRRAAGGHRPTRSCSPMARAQGARPRHHARAWSPRSPSTPRASGAASSTCSAAPRPRRRCPSRAPARRPRGDGLYQLLLALVVRGRRCSRCVDRAAVAELRGGEAGSLRRRPSRRRCTWPRWWARPSRRGWRWALRSPGASLAVDCAAGPGLAGGAAG